MILSPKLELAMTSLSNVLLTFFTSSLSLAINERRTFSCSLYLFNLDVIREQRSKSGSALTILLLVKNIHYSQ